MDYRVQSDKTGQNYLQLNWELLGVDVYEIVLKAKQLEMMLLTWKVPYPFSVQLDWNGGQKMTVLV